MSANENCLQPITLYEGLVAAFVDALFQIYLEAYANIPALKYGPHRKTEPNE